MILENLSRLTLLVVLIAAPWVYGGATLGGQLVIYGGVSTAILAWALSMLARRRTIKSQEPWTPPAVLLCAGAVLLFAAFQLLPLPWSGFSLSHAVLADWLDDRLPWRNGPAPISLVPADTLLELIRLFFAFAVMLLASVLFSERRSRTILFAVAAGNGAVLAVFGLVQKLNWNGMIYWTVPLTQGGQPFASYVNRNNAAGYLNLALACAFGLLLSAYATSQQRDLRRRVSSKHPHSPNRRSAQDRSEIEEGQPTTHGDESRRRRSSTRRTSSDKHRSTRQHRRSPDGRLTVRPPSSVGIVLALLLAIVVGVIASSSRGGIVSLVVMALVAVWLFAESRYARVVIPAVLVVSTIAISVVVWSGAGAEVGRRLSTLRYLEQLSDSRVRHWQDTLQAVRDFPWLGTGLGTYPQAHRPYQTHVSAGRYDNADSEYVEWLLEGGVIGCTLMALLVIAACFSAWRLLSKRFGPPVSDAGAVLALVLVGQLVQSTTDFGISLPANQLLAAAILGSCAARSVKSRRVEQGATSPTSFGKTDHRIWQIHLALAVVILLAGCGFGLHQMSIADRIARFQSSLRSLSLPSVESQTQTTIALDQLPALLQDAGNNGRLHRTAARLYVDQLRVLLYEGLNGPSAKPSEQSRIWQQTAPANLLSAVMAERRAGRATSLDRSLERHELRENLRQAVYHLRRAKASEPLLPDVDFLLVCLAGELQRSPGNMAAHLAREAVLSPADPGHLEGLGNAAIMIGQPSLAGSCWKRSLVLDPSHAGRLLRTAMAEIGEATTLEEVVPSESPELLVLFAEAATTQRVQAIHRAASSLTGNSAGEHFLRGRIAELQNDPAAALEAYAAAVDLEPFHRDWRLRLAALCETTGDLATAIDHLTICVNNSPHRRDLRERLSSLQQRQAAHRSPQ